MQRACLEETEWILKTISICKGIQVDPEHVRNYVSPALKDAFQKSQSACEIYESGCLMARRQAEFDPHRKLLSFAGSRCLGDILLRGDFKKGHECKQVQSMSACLVLDCPCFTQTCRLVKSFRLSACAVPRLAILLESGSR
jgi:hypothetical protein